MLYLERYPEEASASYEDLVRGCVGHSAGFLSACVLEAFELRKMLNNSVRNLLERK
jgi:hypothetical protein